MLAALASLGLSAPKEATIDSTLAAPNVAAAQHEEKWTPTQHEKHWTPAQHEKYVELGMTKQVKADQCTSLKQMQDEHTLKMAQAMTEIELRWTRGGYFDNVPVSQGEQVARRQRVQHGGGVFASPPLANPRPMCE